MKAENNRKALTSRYTKEQRQIFDYLRSRLRGKKGEILDDTVLQKAATLRYAAMLISQEKELADAKSATTVAAQSQEDAVPSDAPEPTNDNPTGTGA